MWYNANENKRKEVQIMVDKEHIERNSLLDEVKQIEGVFARPLIITQI
jgi:hypothetical protein